MKMSDLEDLGFLKQTHASSGRIPTTQGYRLYVDSVLRRVDNAGPSVKLLKKMMEHKQGLEKMLASASEMLSRVSDYVGIAAITPLDTVRFHHVNFVRMGERQVLLLVVLQGGLVHQKFINVAVDMPQEDLDSLAAKLNRFSGMAWSDIKKTVKKELLADIGRYHDECEKAVLAIDSMLGAHEPKIFTGSFSHMMNLQDFQDLGRMQALCSFLEEEDSMAELVKRCSADGLNVMIGEEKRPARHEGLVDSRSYGRGGRAEGRRRTDRPRAHGLRKSNSFDRRSAAQARLRICRERGDKEMTDQEKENRAGTENEEPKAAEAAANEAAASEAVRDGEIKKLTADVEKQADEIKKLKKRLRARAPTTSTSARGWSATARATRSSPPSRR